MERLTESLILSRPIVDKAKNNIIILPILPLSVNGEKDSSEVLKSLNKSDLINFINTKLNLTLDRDTVNSGGDEANSDSSLTNTTNIIVYAPESGSKSTIPSSKSFSPSNESSNSSSVGSFLSGSNNRPQFDVRTPTSSSQESEVTLRSRMLSDIVGNDSSSSSSNGCCREMSLDLRSRLSSGKDLKYDWKISDDVFKHAIQLEYTTNHLKSVFDHASSSGKSMSKLNTLEENRLEEVNQTFRYLSVTLNHENKKTLISKIEEAFQYFEAAVKKLIIRLKNIQSFKNMCQEDQIALLKGSVGEIKGLLNVRYFNPNRELYVVPDPNVTMGREICLRCF